MRDVMVLLLKMPDGRYIITDGKNRFEHIMNARDFFDNFHLDFKFDT